MERMEQAEHGKLGGSSRCRSLALSGVSGAIGCSAE